MEVSSLRRRISSALGLAAIALSLTCGGDGGSGTDDAVLSGKLFASGPVRGATCVARQLVNGTVEYELGRAVTTEDGSWSIAHDSWEAALVECSGGTYTELTGGAVTLDASTTIRAVVLDLQVNEQRTGITISPLTTLVVELARARANAGKDDSFYASVAKANERFTNHFGFAPVSTPVAPLSPVGSLTQEAKHLLVLAGLSEMARSVSAQQGETISTVTWLQVLARDAASAEALFDGAGAPPMFVGSSCPPPPGCTVEGPGCYADCRAQSNSLKGRLGAQVLAFLRTPANLTTLNRGHVETWLEEQRTRVDSDLFGSDPAEAWDQAGPAITWITPAADATVTGSIAVEVTAADPLGVASLTVRAETPTPMQLVDTDPSPERFAATFSTVGLPEGPLTLTAMAIDTEDNRTDAPRSISLDNVSGGTASGVVYKGRVGGATVRFFQFQNGVRGAQVGSGVTASDGSFTNVMIADGHSGPLFVEVGFAGTYPEEAASATVTLDVNDRMRTIVPSYAEGNAISNLVVSPLSSFATTYFEYLQQTNQGGSTLAERWTTARTGIENHFGVANLYSLTPLAPSEMTTFNAQARYGMIMVGLSETARAASTLGGGDGGTFGSAMNAMRVFRVLDTDLADGCWDGRQGATQLFFGGTRAVTNQSLRLDLANRIVAYLADGARNQTPYAGAADILTQLDTLASGGGNMSPGSCSATGKLNPDAGGPFDQSPPTISITTVPAGPIYAGIVTVNALATDDLDTRPTLRFTAPAGTADLDGDPNDSDASANIDTRVMFPNMEGVLTVALESFDDAGNRGTGQRMLTVDNLAPTIAIGGVTDGGWYSGTVNPTAVPSDTHLASFTLTLNSATFTSGTPVSAEGRHVLVATAFDQAGNMRTVTTTFYIDLTKPTLSLDLPAPPAWIRQNVTFTATLDDTMKQFNSLDSNIVVTATGPLGSVSLSPSYPSTMNGTRKVSVSIDTTAIDTMAGSGTLTIRFNGSDRVNWAADELVVSREIDNAPPNVTLLPVRNQTGPVVDGFINEATATIRGTVPAGGSPTTVTLTVTPTVGTVMVTPDALGNWSYVTPQLAEGGYVVNATAVDLAGNVSAMVDPMSFTVDRTPPTITLLQSSVLDERNCDVSVNVTPTGMNPGTIGSPPVTYGACGGMANAVRLDTATAATHIGKFTTRLTASTNDNPLLWLPQATDGSGVGVAQSGSTIQFRVHRNSQAAPGVWVDTSAISLVNGLLSAEAHVTSAQWPETMTHTEAFTIEVRAVDRLGNVSNPNPPPPQTPQTIKRSWFHRPLAPPVLVRYVGLTNPNDATLGSFSLFKHSLTPGAGQVGLATAMSSGFFNDAPRGMYEYEIWNPHDEDINVGFYIPTFGGGSYTTQVWEVNPYITDTPGIVNNPSTNICGWPAETTSFRMTGGSAPFTCGSGTTCTCFTAASPEPVDVKPAPTTGAVNTSTLRVVAWNATPAVPVRLSPQSLTPTLDGFTFYEFAVPKRVMNSTVASRVRVMIALPNLDLFSPIEDSLTQTVQESDGLNAEYHLYRMGSSSFVPTMTVVFKERWADCRATNPTTGLCTAMHARRRLRATVQAAVSVPMQTLKVHVRARSIAATTAVPEGIPSANVRDGQLGNSSAAVSWGSCETGSIFPCPTIPDFPFGVAF